MISSVVNVYQLALDAVGTRSNISATTESSREAEVCNRWYDSVRDQLFRSAFWPCSKRTARLALLAERDFDVEWTVTDPDPPWTYVYSLPSDFLAARFLSTYARFSLTNYNGVQTGLHTNQEDAILFYSGRIDNPAAWDASLQLAVVYGLAAFICLPLTGKPSRTKYLQDLANDLVLQARVNAANEDENSYDSIPEWIEARGAANLGPRSRFIMPYGPILTTATETSPSV